ncbi:hypothetical protein AbraIFM66951_004681 [Aspergillus brasiliensis]|uniref:Transcription factor domain-containing protein n=1 Tax=Aspergillus brasiliensis TaxID=319629 RepID=A0A9W5YJE7_9EURO|nr:hypothetical protein AbraCBS73388_008304 [Aspergillus brasiliensis]GKZ43437.1 hypothetical protein AbraIFM66951_004681 [Aspergillus brasiliensis]
MPTKALLSLTNTNLIHQGTVDRGFLYSCLPPVHAALILLDHFIHSMQLNFGVLHTPSTRTLMEESHSRMQSYGSCQWMRPCFYCSVSSPTLLLSGPRSFCRTCEPSLPKPKKPMQRTVDWQPTYKNRISSPSFMALAAVTLLTHLYTNADGLPNSVCLLRARGLLMARAMRIHCLDSPRAREQRRLNGAMKLRLKCSADI